MSTAWAIVLLALSAWVAATVVTARWHRHEWRAWGPQTYETPRAEWQRCDCGARRIYEPETGYSYGRWQE